jgi:hypothetical protein
VAFGERSDLSQHGNLASNVRSGAGLESNGVGVCVPGTVPGPLLETIGEFLAPEPTPSHGVDSLVVRAFGYLQAVAPRADRPGSP